MTVRILGIESTCDETGVAVVDNGTDVVVNLLASSVHLQKKFGGIVPEVAAREQVRVITPLLKELMRSVEFESLDAIAVSIGPGLVGSLLIGVETAKTIALFLNKPLISVNHLTAHIFANFLDNNQKVEFPILGLIISGGHTDLILVNSPTSIKLLGSTLDDSVGEAFDKIARFMRLPYPGGPEVDKLARKSKGDYDFRFTRPYLQGSLDFSFSGLKTHVVNFLDKQKSLSQNAKFDVCLELERTIADVIVVKLKLALSKYKVKTIAIGGGVAANSFIREQLKNNFFDEYKVLLPAKENCVDNGAMIAACAFLVRNYVDPLKTQALPGLHFQKN